MTETLGKPQNQGEIRLAKFHPSGLGRGMVVLRQLLGCLLVARSIAAFLPPPGAAHLGSHAVLGQRSQPLRSANNSPPKNARCVCLCLESMSVSRVWHVCLSAVRFLRECACVCIGACSACMHNQSPYYIQADLYSGGICGMREREGQSVSHWTA